MDHLGYGKYVTSQVARGPASPHLRLRDSSSAAQLGESRHRLLRPKQGVAKGAAAAGGTETWRVGGCAEKKRDSENGTSV